MRPVNPLVPRTKRIFEMAEGDKPEYRSMFRPGPIWRNAVGDFWRQGCRYYIEEFDWGICVSKWDAKGSECFWSVDFRGERFDYSHPSGVGFMASQYISRAVSKQQPKAQSLKADDATIYRDRPAITEFMTLVVDDEQKAREPSVLMVCATPTGFRVGLKDDDAGGWLWREADTFIKALNAIEAALQGGNVVWAVPGGKYSKKK